MAIEMISLAMLGSCEVAVLISSDRDFIPVAEFLDSRGIVVIHATFGSLGAELSQRCWTRIDLPRLRSHFERYGSSENMPLTLTSWHKRQAARETSMRAALMDELVTVR